MNLSRPKSNSLVLEQCNLVSVPAQSVHSVLQVLNSPAQGTLRLPGPSASRGLTGGGSLACHCWGPSTPAPGEPV